MANQKILDKKQEVINEVSEKVKNNATMVAFEYHSLTVAETDELRKLLRESGSEFKIYKNTLVNRALKAIDFDLEESLNGPKAFAFGTDAIAPIKVLSEFAKKHPALQIKVGIVDGKITDIDTLNKLATIPSREGLLTMFAGGLVEHAKNIAICLDLYSKKLEENN